MTPLDLLQSLKAYCEEKTGDMQLLARVSENGTESATRPPKVFIGNLPDKEAEKKEAPYILLKFLTGKNEDEERKCMVRIICVTFSEDKQVQETTVPSVTITPKVRSEISLNWTITL